MRAASLRSYIKGEKIILYGEVWSYLFMVKNGEIEATKESFEGRVLRVASFTEGELFWGLAFFHEGVAMPFTLGAQRQIDLPVGATGYSSPLVSRRKSFLGTQPSDGGTYAARQ